MTSADPWSIGDIGILDNNQLANRPGISGKAHACAPAGRYRLQAASAKLQAASSKQQALDIYRLRDYIGYTKGKNNMDSTIKLINKYDRTLVDVIQWLDSNGHSNTEIRSKVDVMLNFERKLKEESEMELTKITYVGD